MSGPSAQKGLLQSSLSYTWNSADALGRGATAVVYLGRHKRTGQVVAVKLFHRHLRYSQCGEDLPELEILRRLKHDNIITVLGIQQELESRQTVLVMEYCEGGSIHSMLNQPQYCYGLPETQFLLVLDHVAAGIQYLRRSGVVHRDIKPANIMRYLTEDGNSVYKLTDFGAARELGDDDNFTSMWGTEEYLHPEMYEKGVLRQSTGQRFDARVDLWSLGVTFYQAATGQLPFQPYGGRSNKQTMYRIISQKESGVISGQQHFDGGPIHWSRDLPSTCLLSSGVRRFLTPLLAGLVESNLAQALSYEGFFSRVQQLRALMRLTVFDYMWATLHSLLLEPSTKLAGLQDVLASVTEVPASQQLLVEGGHALEDIVDPLTPVSAFPTHLRRSTLFLFPRQSSPSPPPSSPLACPDIPAFPEFLNIVDINNDSALALHCQARGQLVHQHTDLVGQQQDSLLQGHLYLRMYVEGRLRAVGKSLQLIRHLVEETRKRFTMFYTSLRSIQAMLIALGHQPDAFFREILHDETYLRVQKKTEERVEEIERYRQDLQGRVMDRQPQSLQWADCCQHTSCSSKVDHQLSVIREIHSRFRRDRSQRDQMSAHDQHIHHIQRQKLQETCTRLLSILTGHCVPARDRLHKQAQEFTGILTKSLAQIIKVEKNNDSVINCQRLLSARLDKMEAKCHSEMEHLEKQLAKVTRGQHLHSPYTALNNQQTSSIDTGLGTAMLGSGSVPGSLSTSHSLRPRQSAWRTGSVTGSMTGSMTGSLDAVSIQHSLQSMRQESEEVLALVMENLDIMKRLEEPSIPAGSSRSLSRITEEATPT